jgi:hypothetical protein
MSKWKEIELTNFRGINTTMTPSKDECASCINFDLRDNLGELVVTPEVTIKYAVPSLTNFTAGEYLGITTFHIDSTTTRAEVTALVIKGVLAKASGSSPSVASKNMLAVCVRPYWSGSAWVDSWKWLDRQILTSLHGKADYVIGAFDFTQAIFNSEPHWVVWNVTKSIAANVLACDASHNITISRNDFAISDTVIFMTNFFPVSYMDEMYNTTPDQLSFHKINGELRIGFGGYANRLGMSVKYLKKYGCVTTLAIGAATYKDVINNYDEIILDPYNIITGLGTYSSAATVYGGSPSVADTGFISGLDTGTNLYYVVTAVLDGYQEYGVFSATTGVFTTSERSIYWRPVILRASINKRLTGYKLYVAITDRNNNSQIATKYKQVGNVTFSQDSSGGTGWEVLSNGDVRLITPLEITKQTFNKASLELNSLVGYTINKAEEDEYGIETTYASSWDRAVLTQGKTFILNPYIASREVNVLYKSIISGTGAKMYDVIPPEDRISLEGRDGNDVLEMIVDQSSNIIVSRPNNIQIVDPQSGASQIIAPGVGGVSRRGMVHMGTHIIIPGEYGINGISGNSSQNISDPIRVAYKAISDKSLVLGIRDEYRNSFRMYDGTAAEYIYTPELGWVTATSSHITRMKCYGIDEDGRVLILKSDGNIYYRDNASQYEGISCERLSIPFDTSFLGEDVKATDGLLIGRFWIKYLSPEEAITISFYFDGTLSSFTLTAPANSTYAHKDLSILPSCRVFQFKIACTLAVASDDIRIKAMGFSLKKISFGRFGASNA